MGLSPGWVNPTQHMFPYNSGEWALKEDMIICLSTIPTKTTLGSSQNFQLAQPTLSRESLSHNSPSEEAMFGDVIQKPDNIMPLHYKRLHSDHLPSKFSRE